MYSSFHFVNYMSHISVISMQAVIMVDSSSLYGSRNLFDQYGDMRLDIDDMSYEVTMFTLIPLLPFLLFLAPFNFKVLHLGQELLALGESIGHVSTGLSEDMVSKCLTKTTYHSSDQNQEEAMCTICLVRTVAPYLFQLDRD